MQYFPTTLVHTTAFRSQELRKNTAACSFFYPRTYVWRKINPERTHTHYKLHIPMCYMHVQLCFGFLCICEWVSTRLLWGKMWHAYFLSLELKQTTQNCAWCKLCPFDNIGFGRSMQLQWILVHRKTCAALHSVNGLKMKIHSLQDWILLEQWVFIHSKNVFSY